MSAPSPTPAAVRPAGMREAVVRAKLTPPSLPLSLVPRPRLTARLSAHAGRLVLVSAPAGFGKTALVAEWLRQQPRAVAWLSLDASDNDPTRFFHHLSAALAALPLAAAGRAAALASALAQGNAGTADVQAAFAALGTDALLVLDDVHEIESPRLLDALALLLGAAGGPRVLLLTRVDPPLPLARPRLAGELLELRERDLRFSREECEALFAMLLPGRLDDGLVEQLEARTEGWAAGLRLAAIALQDGTDAARMVASFAGSHRLVVDYLVEEALERQSPALQQFLMDTAVLERFTPEACAAVTQEPDARARLEEIEAANLFLVPLGEERSWYRYHHLFRELLLFRLHRLDPARAELLHRRASEWFEQAGEMHYAIEHATRMQDANRLLELLDAHAFDALAASELATLQRWLARVPDALAQPWPMMLVALGWLRVLTERAPDLQPVFHAAAAALARVPESYDAARRLRARLSLEVLRGFEARFAGRYEEALLVSRAALQDVPEDDTFTRGLLTFNLARLEMLVGEMPRAAALLEQAFEVNLQAGTAYLQLTALAQLAAVRAQLEGTQRARQELSAAVAFAGQRHLASVPAFSAVLYHLAHVEYLADRLEEADDAAGRALALARAGNFPEGVGNALMLLARVAAARGRFAQAEAQLTELAALARESNLVLIDTTASLEQARLALTRELAGDAPPAPPLAPPETTGCWSSVRETEFMVRARLALRAGEYGMAESLARSLERECSARGRGVGVCVSLFAQGALPDRPDRWDVLERALRLSAERDYVRPIVDAGELVRPLLQSALGQALSPEAKARARVLLERIEATAPARPPAPRASLLEPLTAREAEVLEHLSAGRSNKAIARAMFVSGETVKTHLKHVYWKLEVSSREEAVARARELGLVAAGGD